MILVHTDAPLMALTQMLSSSAFVEVGRAAKGGPDCFYGWAEEQDRPECKPHHVISDPDKETVLWIAATLKMLGHQVVVTGPDDWGNQEVWHDMPSAYDHAGGHTH